MWIAAWWAWSGSRDVNLCGLPPTAVAPVTTSPSHEMSMQLGPQWSAADTFYSAASRPDKSGLISRKVRRARRALRDHVFAGRRQLHGSWQSRHVERRTAHRGPGARSRPIGDRSSSCNPTARAGPSGVTRGFGARGQKQYKVCPQCLK